MYLGKHTCVRAHTHIFATTNNNKRGSECEKQQRRVYVTV